MRSSPPPRAGLEAVWFCGQRAALGPANGSARSPNPALLFQMWKASAGHAVSLSQDDGGADDWETDPDFVV